MLCLKALQLEWLCARYLQNSGQLPHHRRLQLENQNGLLAVWAIPAQLVSMKRTISIDTCTRLADWHLLASCPNHLQFKQITPDHFSSRVRRWRTLNPSLTGSYLFHITNTRLPELALISKHKDPHECNST